MTNAEHPMIYTPTLAERHQDELRRRDSRAAAKRKPGPPRAENAVRRWPKVRVDPELLERLCTHWGLAPREAVDKVLRELLA